MGWSNWSGSVSSPATVAYPRDEGELAALVQGAAKVRAVGAGHSFMPLCASDAAIISLDAMTGDLAIAADRRTARIPAGWSITRLTAALWAQALALANPGDDDPQPMADRVQTAERSLG